MFLVLPMKFDAMGVQRFLAVSQRTVKMGNEGREGAVLTYNWRIFVHLPQKVS
jgi:hypothetical protein